MKLAIIGGTGKQGTALARRFARAGLEILIGSRDAGRAQGKAADLAAGTGLSCFTGLCNRDATAGGEVVILSVPYDGMPPILTDIREAAQDKIVVNMASALDPRHKTHALPPPAGSITAEVQQFLGERCKVVAAFQNISPDNLEGDGPCDSDVLVCGADRAAREQVVALVGQAGMRALDAGVLANAVAVETLTALLIHINIRYKVKGAGIRITGV